MVINVSKSAVNGGNEPVWVKKKGMQQMIMNAC